MMGADFVLTGSINQCTVEAGTSEMAKIFWPPPIFKTRRWRRPAIFSRSEARVQVLRKGTLFAARANKLYDLYGGRVAMTRLDRPTLEMIQKNYFSDPLQSVGGDPRRFNVLRAPEIVASAEANPKQKMAMIFRW